MVWGEGGSSDEWGVELRDEGYREDAVMPLLKSKSEKAFHTNIREMVKAGHPMKQAVAVAYKQKREAERKKK